MSRKFARNILSVVMLLSFLAMAGCQAAVTTAAPQGTQPPVSTLSVGIVLPTKDEPR